MYIHSKSQSNVEMINNRDLLGDVEK